METKNTNSKETVLKVENLQISFMTSNGEAQAVRESALKLKRRNPLNCRRIRKRKKVLRKSVLRLLADTAVIKKD